MPFKHFSAGEGGGQGSPFGNSFLPASDIAEGLNVTIKEVVEISPEESAFGKAQLYVNLDIEGREGATWGPGTMASSHLVNELGDEPDLWKGQKCHFHHDSWKTNKRSGTAWFLILDHIPKQKNLPSPEKGEKESKSDSEKKVTPKSESFDCEYCKKNGNRFMSDDVSDYTKHLADRHNVQYADLVRRAKTQKK